MVYILFTKLGQMFTHRDQEKQWESRYFIHPLH